MLELFLDKKDLVVFDYTHGRGENAILKIEI